MIDLNTCPDGGVWSSLELSGWLAPSRLRRVFGRHRRRLWRVANFILAVCVAAQTLCTAVRPAIGQTNPATDAVSLAEMRLLLCIQGKGSCLPYDAGVLREAYARMPALGRQQVIVAGNSSGSIAAAYFGCFGMTDQTLSYAERRFLEGTREAVRLMENPHSKLAKLARGRPTEIPHAVLREYVAFALGVDRWQDAASVEEVARRSTARPRYPMLIVACNKEVLEDAHPENRNRARGLKEIDPDTMLVSWREEVHAFYQEHPEVFAREHPNLRLSASRRIGRAVTYFVDQSLFDLLRQIPAEERQADLRLMTDAEDVAFAILASASEPTYFDPVEDPRPEKILTGDKPGDLGNVRRRMYYGGYILSLPAQDLRRMLPGIRVLGTGWRHNPLVARQLLRNRLLADVEPIAQRAEWWADMEVNPDVEFQAHMIFRDLSARDEYEFGRQRARECFSLGGGLPEFVIPPKHAQPAASAVWPAFEDEDMHVAGPDGRQTLRTLRGLGPLLAPSLKSTVP